VLSDCNLTVVSNVLSGRCSFAESFIGERRHQNFRLESGNGKHGWLILSVDEMSVANVGGQKEGGSWRLSCGMGEGKTKPQLSANFVQMESMKT